MQKAEDAENWLNVRLYVRDIAFAIILLVALKSLLNMFLRLGGAVCAYGPRGESLSCVCRIIVFAVPVIYATIRYCLRNRRYRCMIRKNSELSLEEGTIPLCPDSPIKWQNEDVLSRMAYVNALNRMVMSDIARTGALYVGVYGSWGDGKTSILNLLETRMNEEYKDHAVLVRFSPWEYPESYDLRTALFEKVGRTLSQRGDSEPHFVFSQLSQLLSLERAGERMGLLQNARDLFRWLWFEFIMKKDEFRHRMRELLQSMPLRVVIAIDDIDRLTDDEVCSVLRFLKANGDWPNLVYLILAEEDHLARAASKLATCESEKRNAELGYEYLQKIVPIKFPLPEINAVKKRDFLLVKMKWLLDAYNVEYAEIDGECAWAAHYLRNLRQVKMYANLLSADLALRTKCMKSKCPGVHVGDFLMLAALRFAEPEVYARLFEGYSELLRRQQQYNMPGHEKLPNDWLEKTFFERLHDKDNEHLSVFLIDRMHIVSDEKLGYKLDCPGAPELMCDARLASEFFIEDYFFPNEGGRLRREDVDEFKSSVAKGVIPKELVERMNREGTLGELLYALRGLDVMHMEANECYLDTLTYIADQNLTPLDEKDRIADGMWFEMTAYVRAYQCFYVFCRKMDAGYSGGQDLKNDEQMPMPLTILHNRKDVVISAFLILGERDGARFPFMLADERQQLHDDYLASIVCFQKEGRLLHHEEFNRLLGCWRLLLEEREDPALYEKFRTAIADDLDNYDALNRILPHFVGDNRIVDYTNDFVVWADIDKFLIYFGDLHVGKIIETLNGTDVLSERDFKTLKVLQWALEERKNGRPYDVERQKEYLSAEIKKDEFREEMRKRTGKKM